MSITTPNARGALSKRAKAMGTAGASKGGVYLFIRAALVVGYVGFIAACFVMPWGPRVFWTMLLPLLPLGIVLMGFHRWRRICPLAFWGQLGTKIKRRKQRRISKWLDRWFYLVTFGFLFTMLALRLVATNGDGVWLAGLLIGLAVLAFLTNTIYTGKTWCNVFCPVGLVERIYTEPQSLPPTENSQCVKCTACKKNCPDIDSENGYWKDLVTPGRAIAFYSFPGLVLGFYTYYWLRAGEWSAYFDGAWTAQPVGTDLVFGPGFFFAPQIPAIVAAPLTLFAFSLISGALFYLVEQVVSSFYADKERCRHHMLTISAFAAFNLFYIFAGAPTLRLLPGAVQIVAFLAPLVATLFLVKRWRRSRGRYVIEQSAKKLLKKWTFEEEPPDDPAQVFAYFKAHGAAHESQLAAYRESVMEVLSDGQVTASELRLIGQLREQLSVTEKEHNKIMAELSDTQRSLFVDDAVSIEQRLQREEYEAALSAALMRQASTRELDTLRRDHAIDKVVHATIMARLTSDEGPLLAKARELFDQIDQLRRSLGALVPMSFLHTFSFVIYVLLKEQDRRVDRILDVLALCGDEDRVRILSQSLFTADKHMRRAALVQLRSATDPSLVDRLEPIIMDRRPKTDVLDAEARRGAMLRLLQSTDPYQRAGVIFAIGEVKDEHFKQALLDALRDNDPLVRETAVYAALHAEQFVDQSALKPLTRDPVPSVRQAAVEALDAIVNQRQPKQREMGTIQTGRFVVPPVPDERFSSFATLEKILLLRCVALFVDLDPEDLHEMCRYTTEVTVSPPTPICVQGDQSNDLYIVVDGEASVCVKTEAGESEVARLGAGDVFGELAAIDGSPRSATVKAAGGPVRLLKLDGRVFRSRFASRPDVAPKILSTLAQRLRTTLARLGS